MHSITPIIFTDELRAKALLSPRHRGPLLHKWARLDGDRGDTLRAQLERAARLVPEAKRRRVIGPITAKGSSDDQVRCAVESLLLAKTLHDLGWMIEFEPEEGERTPDLRIEKDGSALLVELRRVAAPTRYPSDEAFDRLKDACDGLWTTTPIGIRGLSIDGQASLKPFRSYLEKLLESRPSPGSYSFHEGQVYVGFELFPEMSGELPAVFSCQYGPVVGTPKDEVRAHIDEKIARYPVPLIVALDFYDYAYAFSTVEEVLLGSEIINVPLRFGGETISEAPFVSRAGDSIFLRRINAGDRARSRLEGVLSFFALGNDSGAFDVFARLYANPYSEPPQSFAEFAPIPRLVVVESDAVSRRLAHLGAEDRVLDIEEESTWRHTP